MMRLLPLLIALLMLPALACSVITRITPTPGPATPVPDTPAAVTPGPATPAVATPAATRRASATPRATRTPARSASATPAPAGTPNPEWLEVFQLVWEDVRDNYVYPDYNGADWLGLYDEYRARVEAARTPDAFYEVMHALIDELRDDHSVFLSPEEAREDDAVAEGRLDYVGIGILRVMQEEKRRAVVLLVFADSPAERAGLQAHDSILAIDGLPVIDDEGNSNMEHLRGPEGTSVTITVQSPGESPRDITLRRARVLAQYPVEARRLDGDIGYLMIPAFDDLTIGDRAIEAFEALVDDGPPLRGLILDLRLNHGGYSTVLEQILGLFTRGTVGHFLTQSERRPLEIRANDVGGSQDVPLVVLVGEGTASFGEVCSGVLQDLGRATIVGTVTEGNVEIIWSYNYQDGSRAWIAQETFESLNGDDDWEQTGIVPDLIVDADWGEYTDDNDPHLAAALDLLR
jgi:C-terminal peptidase prc